MPCSLVGCGLCLRLGVLGHGALIEGQGGGLWLSWIPTEDHSDVRITLPASWVPGTVSSVSSGLKGKH